MIGFGLIVERVFFWFFERRRVDLREVDAFFEEIHSDDFEAAKAVGREADTSLLNTLTETWENNGQEALVEALDLAINRIEKRSQRYLYGLKTIVSVSPLLGILGTVIGIIQSFQVLGSAGAAANPQAVGSGLAEALVTTAFGLMIAVPCLIVHNYFLSRARNYVDTLDEYAEELVFHLNGNNSQSENDSPGQEKPESSSSPAEHVA
jgi:biopolymer transport protein ExbB